MRPPLHVHYTLASPWTFLGWDRLGELVAESGVEVRYHLIDHGVIFPATGGLPISKRAPARQQYRMLELERWSKRLNIPINLEPRYFPVNDADAAAMVLAAREQGLDVWRLSRAFMAAIWQEERNIADAATRTAIVEEQGFDPQALVAGSAGMADVRQRESEEAITQGVFGAPFFIYGDTRLWGQDRLDFLAEAMRG